MRTALSCLAISTWFLVGSAAKADYTLAAGTFTVSENFNGLPSTGTTPQSGTVGTANALSGTGFVGTKTGGTGSTLNLIASDGSSNTGALFSYGVTGSSERALGTLASGTTIPAFGAEIVNASGVDIQSFTLTIDREQWRSSTTAANTIAFAYGVSGSGITSANFLTSSAMTALSTFDLVGDHVVASNGALNGNSNSITLTGTIPVSLLAGQSLFIRWTDANDAGNDAGLAIDNFSLVGHPRAVPEPSSVALIAIGLGGAFLRARRSRKTA